MKDALVFHAMSIELPIYRFGVEVTKSEAVQQTPALAAKSSPDS
jgi:hypothetical protein